MHIVFTALSTEPVTEDTADIGKGSGPEIGRDSGIRTGSPLNHQKEPLLPEPIRPPFIGVFILAILIEVHCALDQTAILIGVYAKSL